MLADVLLVLSALVLMFVTIGLELYFIYAIVISKNCKYPPAFPSFGNMKKLSLAEAREVLAESGTPLRVVDLGCGTGTMLLPLAREFPEHFFVGYDWDRFVTAIIRFRSRKMKNVEIIRDDFMKADIASYDLLLCFLDTKAAEDLSDEMKEKLKPGAVVVSNAFELKGMVPEKILDAKSYGMPLKVYVYKNK